MSASDSQSKRILCAEDDENSYDLLAFLLSDYEVVFTDSVKKSIDLFKSQHFDLCLLDNWLTDGFGTDLCKEIRSINPSIPIIFASGVAQKDEIQKAIDVGAQAYLVKPYCPEELQNIVKELLETSSQP